MARATETLVTALGALMTPMGACKPVGFITRLLRLSLRHWQGGSRDNAYGRRPRACRPARGHAIDTVSGDKWIFGPWLTSVAPCSACPRPSRCAVASGQPWPCLRATLPEGWSGRKDGPHPSNRRMPVQAAGIASAASNGRPLFSTPKQITSSLRMAAIRICFGLSRLCARSLAANAATAALCRRAAIAGM